jgi:hypothetical protein
VCRVPGAYWGLMEGTTETFYKCSMNSEAVTCPQCISALAEVVAWRLTPGLGAQAGDGGRVVQLSLEALRCIDLEPLDPESPFPLPPRRRSL